MANPFLLEAQVWLSAAGITAAGADNAAFNAHQRKDADAVRIYGEAEGAANVASTAVTVEAVFTPSLQGLRHTIWCAAFVVYMQRHHPDLLPPPLKPQSGFASWEDVVKAAEAARTGG